MAEYARSGSPFEELIGFSRAVRVGPLACISGTAPVGSSGENVGVDDPVAQTRRCLEIIEQSLIKIRMSLKDVVRTRIYLTDAADWEAVGRVHGEVFQGINPASSMVVVAALLRPEWKVEIEADAYSTDGG